MTKKVIYRFKCGYTGQSKIRNRKKVCPECGERVEGRWLKCNNCGNHFSGRLTGSCQKFCPECQKARSIEARRNRDAIRDAKRVKSARYIEEKNKSIAKIIEIKTRKNMKPTCMFYEHCLKFDLKKDPNTCVKCDRYVNFNFKARTGN